MIKDPNFYDDAPRWSCYCCYTAGAAATAVVESVLEMPLMHREIGILRLVLHRNALNGGFAFLDSD